MPKTKPNWAGRIAEFLGSSSGIEYQLSMHISSSDRNSPPPSRFSAKEGGFSEYLEFDLIRFYLPHLFIPGLWQRQPRFVGSV